MTARAVCFIDLDALAHNLAEVQRIVGPKVRVCGVVKANAYGHGAVPVARTLLRGGAGALAVACFEEAEELRTAGLAVPILILGGIDAELAADAVRLGLTPVVWDAEALREIASAVPSGRRLQIHLKVDTGMHRLGAAPSALEELIRTATELSVEVDGVLSHLACADEPENASVAAQLAEFEEALALAEEVGLRPRIRHLAASAGLLADARTHFDMVRAGLVLYGCLPHASFADRVTLRPVMELRTHVVQVKTIPPGDAVGYGFTWRAERQTRLAVLPIGYGQGYPRALSNRHHRDGPRHGRRDRRSGRRARHRGRPLGRHRSRRDAARQERRHDRLRASLASRARRPPCVSRWLRG